MIDIESIYRKEKIIYFFKYILPFLIVAVICGFIGAMTWAADREVTGVTEKGALVIRTPIPIIIEILLIAGNSLLVLSLIGLNLFRSWLFHRNFPDKFMSQSVVITKLAFAFMISYALLKFVLLTEVSCGIVMCSPV